MSFIPKSPISMTKLSTPPLPPPEGTRGLFAASDGWYEIDDQGNVRKIGGNDEAEDYELFKYYNSTDITPSDESLFVFSNGSVKSASEDISGDIVIPYKYLKDGEEHIVRQIGTSAFLDCVNITGVVIPNTVEELRENAFCGCTGIKNVTLPDSVTVLYDWAFLNCSALESVILPRSVKKIRPRVFKGCTSLTDVYYNGTEEEWNSIEIGEENECLLNAKIHFNWLDVTKEYVDKKIKELIGAAPEVLDTLKELSEALGNDPNFATTVLTEIGKKVDKVDGKGLSTNDFTDTDKDKVDNIKRIYIQSEEPEDALEGSIWIDTDEELGALPRAEGVGF